MKIRMTLCSQTVIFCIMILGMLPGALFPGVYTGTAECSDSADCAPLGILSDPDHAVTPFAITHPPGYNGSGGIFQLRICVLEGSEAFVGPASRAIATWNALTPTVENCEGCKVWEEPSTPLQIAHAESVLLHELGHCPLGLAHPDRNWDAQIPPDLIWEPTSFTRSVGVALPPDGISVGADFIRGTLDDVQIGAGAIPDNPHWFRIVDNDPAAVDSTVIDINTYSPSVVLHLPDGHSWVANANRRANETLGYTDTQAVMYSLTTEGERKTSLTADDVNMIKMGMAGQDLVTGTADDYSIELVLVESCEEPVDVIITLGKTDPDELARCDSAAVDYSFPQNPFLARHFTLTTPTGGPFFIFLNQNLTWITEETDVFIAGFETGDFSEWSSVFPAR